MGVNKSKNAQNDTHTYTHARARANAPPAIIFQKKFYNHNIWYTDLNSTFWFYHLHATYVKDQNGIYASTAVYTKQNVQ